MSKLISLSQEMIIDELATHYSLKGKVTKSNYVEEGYCHILPIHNEPFCLLNKGDRIRITKFVRDDKIEKTAEGIKFTTSGIRYEKWNEENNGWDKIWEQFLPTES